MGNNRCVKLLAFYRRRTTELTCRDLGVLRFDRVNHVDRRQLVFGQLCRIHPDTHRILRTKQLNVAHPRGTADRIFHIGGNVIRNILLGHGAVGVNDAHYHQEAT